jgi:hypothetical protein
MQSLQRQRRDLATLPLPAEAREIFAACPRLTIASRPEELYELAVAHADSRGMHEVAYEIPGRGRIVEAQVCRVRNGISANYLEPRMRRRDPDSMVIGDDLPTNKPRYHERFGQPFEPVRQETFEWLKTQELAAFYFIAGHAGIGLPALAIAPANAGFFALGLALLQGIIALDDLPAGFMPRAVIYTAPPFRHTHFEGRQIVVHNRRPTRETGGPASLPAHPTHELFSYNLYPGPSAKKGIYGVLINLGEQEGWVTAHCSTVQVVTPYENIVTFMHEGASGGGKSEMLEYIHREPDGELLLGRNIVTGDQRRLVLPRGCTLRPVTDDMALCHPSFQFAVRSDGRATRKLSLRDAEDAWFVRVNHIASYGTDPNIERLTIHPPEPFLFLNIDAAPGSTALIWEHIEDSPGVPCPNPRVVVPRRAVPGVVDGTVTVDIRSIGVRAPPCTREHPSYGIIGLFHILPPALAWLWRLVAPRGYANPSIVETQGMSSEGVGSYWPFATGRRVDQANLLLRQIMATPDTLFILTPNQHIGAWKVGFMPQWITREYLARRGAAPFRPEQIQPSRCALLGSNLEHVMVEGAMIGTWFTKVYTQPEVGEEAYDAGARILEQFFHEQVRKFLEPDLDALGARIIECCLDGGGVHEYEVLGHAAMQ